MPSDFAYSTIFSRLSLSFDPKGNLNTTFFIEEESEPDFKLDLKFLLTGTNYGPLKSLCGYERYIIFLKFKEDKSILEMSRILQKDRRVVKKHFDLIIEKIKESYSL